MYEANIQQRAIGARTRSLPRRRVQPIAAIQAGMLAGAVALGLFLFMGSVVYDESPWKFLRMIAAMVRGRDALEPDDEFDALPVGIAFILHFALSALYALAICALVADTPRRYGAFIGIAFGVALYHANLYGFTAIFPWFSPFRTIDTFAIHAIFGLLVAKGYWFFRR